MQQRLDELASATNVVDSATGQIKLTYVPEVLFEAVDQAINSTTGVRTLSFNRAQLAQVISAIPLANLVSALTPASNQMLASYLASNSQVTGTTIGAVAKADLITALTPSVNDIIKAYLAANPQSSSSGGTTTGGSGSTTTGGTTTGGTTTGGSTTTSTTLATAPADQKNLTLNTGTLTPTDLAYQYTVSTGYWLLSLPVNGIGYVQMTLDANEGGKLCLAENQTLPLGGTSSATQTITHGIYYASNGLRSFTKGNSDYQNVSLASGSLARLRGGLDSSNVHNIYYEYSTDGTTWTTLKTVVSGGVQLYLKVYLDKLSYTMKNVKYQGLS